MPFYEEKTYGFGILEYFLEKKYTGYSLSGYKRDDLKCSLLLDIAPTLERINRHSSIVKKTSGSVSRVLYSRGSDGHYTRPAVASRFCRQVSPSASNLPAVDIRAEQHSILGLAGGGVCLAGAVTGAAVRSCRTISPLPVPRRDIGCVFSVALSRGLPRVAVSHHHALPCSDFPLA